MGKLKCICDYIISDTCGYDAEAFTEQQVDVELEYGFSYFPPGNGRSILECPKCGTLAIEDPIGSCYVKFYKPENEIYNKIFHDRKYIRYDEE